MTAAGAQETGEPSAEAGLAGAVALVEGEAGRTYPAAALHFTDRGAGRLLCAVGEAGLDTWFDLASLTKALCTSVLAMRLCAAGRLRLEEEALPGVTFAQLLGHEGGLQAWLPLYRQALACEGFGTAAGRDAVLRAAESAARGAQGVRAVYSDLGFMILGARIEARAGARLDRLFGEVAGALGAEVAFRPVGEEAAVPAARCAPTRSEEAGADGPGPARAWLQGVVHDDNARAMGGVAGHAGLFGTVAGVGRLARALCEVHEGLDTPLGRALGVPAETVRRFFGHRGMAAGSTWALGWDRPEPPGRRSSAGTLWSRQGVGHLGFTGCSLWLDPGAMRWAVLLTNRACAEDAAAAARTKERLGALRPALHDALMRAALRASG
jgi:CubicO group peptidase (beta-lactamase class C family)